MRVQYLVGLRPGLLVVEGSQVFIWKRTGYLQTEEAKLLAAREREREKKGWFLQISREPLATYLGGQPNIAA
ncbi:hypothetical protein ACN38_g12317 [Penicillium nordicum]|uniref:Uncharacterized protein n=1 Tax=Penicillium nordicum TaxID=229535 RepID=A0A0M8NQX7_9EURO|nr:hypothetical protein ACN38_g12317 [Penicillium nordicum]